MCQHPSSKVIATNSFMNLSENVLTFLLRYTFEKRQHKTSFIKHVIDQSKLSSSSLQLNGYFLISWNNIISQVADQLFSPLRHTSSIKTTVSLAVIGYIRVWIGTSIFLSESFAAAEPIQAKRFASSFYSFRILTMLNFLKEVCD